MSIKVACGSCGWTGTVDDSLAQQRMMCRACAEPIYVPSGNEEAEAGFEHVTDEHLSPDDRKAQAQSAAAALGQRAAKKLARSRKRSKLFSPTLLTVLGATFLIAGFVSLIVDLIVNVSRIHSFVLIVCGCIIGVTGYAFDQATK